MPTKEDALKHLNRTSELLDNAEKLLRPGKFDYEAFIKAFRSFGSEFNWLCINLEISSSDKMEEPKIVRKIYKQIEGISNMENHINRILYAFKKYTDQTENMEIDVLPNLFYKLEDFVAEYFFKVCKEAFEDLRLDYDVVVVPIVEREIEALPK